VGRLDNIHELFSFHFMVIAPVFSLFYISSLPIHIAEGNIISYGLFRHF
jgi:hypothetical protein